MKQSNGHKQFNRLYLVDGKGTLSGVEIVKRVNCSGWFNDLED